jgi:hypothetical protein
VPLTIRRKFRRLTAELDRADLAPEERAKLQARFDLWRAFLDAADSNDGPRFRKLLAEIKQNSIQLKPLT